jgi:hypothetical protein
MLYTEYKHAAEKHLKTCIGIADALDRLKVYDNNALLLTANKQAILHNVFYLSGYVLEAVSTYSIYKHYSWRQNKSVKTKDPNFSSVCDFSFYPKDGYSFYVHEHKFQINQFEVLKVPFNNTGIPLIDSSINVDYETTVLFNLWKPEIRYHEANKSYPYLINKEIILNERNVLKFVSLTKDIYNSLLQTVG